MSSRKLGGGISLVLVSTVAEGFKSLRAAVAAYSGILTLPRKSKREGASPSHLALDPDSPPVKLHQLFGQGQP